MRIGLITLGLLLAACTPAPAPAPATYTADFERNFVTRCEAEGSSAALCNCTWERIEAEVAPEDFTALERLPAVERDTHPLLAQIGGYRDACAASLTPLPGDPLEQVPAP